MADHDVVLLTYNSLEPVLDQCLRAIVEAAEYAAIKIRLIVVDKNSTDGTIELIKRDYRDLSPKILYDEGTRATARQLGINNVETPFFSMIDSDVIISRTWFSKMLTRFMVFENLGAVWGRTIAIDPEERAYRAALRRIYGKDDIEMTMDYAAKRGLTHDTMFRKEAVKFVKIPPILHVYEDHFLRLHVEKRGYVWENVEEPTCQHYRHERISKAAEDDAYYGFLMGSHGRGYLLKHFLAPFKLAYLLAATSNFKLFKIEAAKEYYILRAVFRLILNGKFFTRSEEILQTLD